MDFMWRCFKSACIWSSGFSSNMLLVPAGVPVFCWCSFCCTSTDGGYSGRTDASSTQVQSCSSYEISFWNRLTGRRGDSYQCYQYIGVAILCVTSLISFDYLLDWKLVAP